MVEEENRWVEKTEAFVLSQETPGKRFATSAVTRLTVKTKSCNVNSFARAVKPRLVVYSLSDGRCLRMLFRAGSCGNIHGEVLLTGSSTYYLDCSAA